MHKTFNNDLTILARLIASLLAVSFIVTTLAALVLFNLERRAFNPLAYKQALVSENFYQQFPFLVSDLLTRNISADAPAFLHHISADQWKKIVEALLPEQQMQAMTGDTLNQVFAYFNGETLTPGISLVPLKNNLAGPAGLDAVLTIIQSQPDCTIQQIAKMIDAFGQELCNPPKAILNLLQPIIQIQLQKAASAIPDNVSILQITKDASAQSDLKDLKAIRLMMRLSPLAPIALLLGITILAVRTFKGWLTWWGWPLSLAGLFGIPLGLTGAPVLRWILERWLSKRITLIIPPEIDTTIRAVADATLREILKPVVWESLALFIVGLIMILSSIYLTIREKNKAVASEAKTKIY